MKKFYIQKYFISVFAVFFHKIFLSNAVVFVSSSMPGFRSHSFLFLNNFFFKSFFQYIYFFLCYLINNNLIKFFNKIFFFFPFSLSCLFLGKYLPSVVDQMFKGHTERLTNKIILKTETLQRVLSK